MSTAPSDPSSTRAAVMDVLLGELPVIVFAAGRDGVSTLSEGAGLAALGLRPGELVGRDLFDVYAAYPAELAHLRDALEGRSSAFTWRLGEVVLDVLVQPIVAPRGTIEGFVGIATDIGDRTRVQEDLELYRAFVDAAPQFVALADIDGTVRYVNPGGRRLAGIPDDVDVTRTTIADYLTADGLRRSVEVEQPAVLAQGHYQGETTLRHWPTGRGIPVHVSSFLVTDAVTGAPRALATVQTDISAAMEVQRETERRLSQQRSLLLHLHEAQETERRRIAGEVHDDTVQAVASVNIRLQSALRLLERDGHHGAAAMLAGLGDSVRDATSRLRRLLYDLDVPQRLDQDLVSALQEHATVTCRDEGFRCVVTGSLSAPPPLHVSRVLFRIAQEALANVRRHAAASEVRVEVGERDAGFVLSVRDDGVGMSPQDGASARARPAGEGHLGLRSMGERAESVGGWCSVRGLDGPGGTLVEAWVPARLDYSASVTGGSSSSAQVAHTLLEQTVESIAEGFAALDRDWRYVYVNQLGADIVRRHDLPGKVCWEEFDFSPEVEAAYRDAMRLQHPTTATVLYPDLGRWVENRVYPSPDGIAVFFRDVTSERELERRAEDRERVLGRATRLAAVLAAEPDLRRALREAAELVRETFRLSAVRVSAPQIGDVAVGVAADGDAVCTVRLVLLGEQVGELHVSGPRIPLEALPGVADGLALRVGLGREHFRDVDRSENHG